MNMKWFAAIALSSIAMFGVTSARADTTSAETSGETEEIVVLREGKILRGTLLEKIPGDHVTIRLSTGVVMRIAWENVGAATLASNEPGEAPAGDRAWTIETEDSSDAATTEATESPETEASDAAPWDGAHMIYGVATGIGTPTGSLGALVGYEPASWFEVELGAGLGGSFGFAVEGRARLSEAVSRSMRLGIGVGLSDNYLSASERGVGGKYPDAPALARFLNIEESTDVALGESAFLRLTVGLAFLLNPADYSKGCSSCAGNAAPYTPNSAMALNAEGNRLMIPYVGLEVLWLSLG